MGTKHFTETGYLGGSDTDCMLHARDVEVEKFADGDGGADGAGGGGDVPNIRVREL